MRFISFPWRLYRNEPHWVPPLISERKQHLDRKQQPVLRARRGRVLPRLARRASRSGASRAQVDHRFNEFQEQRWGLFGFFECEDDPEVAERAARRRRGLAARARPRPHGRPVRLHDEPRVRAAGRGLRPAAADHRALAPPLLQRAARGRRASRRRWTSSCGSSTSSTARRCCRCIFELAEKLEPEHGIRVRHMRKRDFEDEIRRFVEIYNAAWENNWGFVPLTEKELRALRQGAEAAPRRELGDDRREGRRDGRERRSPCPTSTRC